MNTSLTAPELLAKERKVFLLPIGSIEQHGPYLPIDTDLRIAHMLAGNLASSFNLHETLLLPAIPFSSSWEHKGLGTIALNVGTIAAILHDVAQSIREWNIPGLLILVNWHGGNGILASLATEISAREGVPTAIIPSTSDIEQASRSSAITTASDVHAGAIETSIIQAYWPDLVKETILQADHLEPDIQPVGVQALLQSIGIHAVSKTGIWGAPEEANRARGKELIENLTKSMVEQVKKLLQFIDQYEEDKTASIVKKE